MPKKKPFKALVEKLFREGKTPSEIRVLVPDATRHYVATIRKRTGLPPFHYTLQRGVSRSGRRVGPVSVEWFKSNTVQDKKGCWNWTLSLFKDGYARVGSSMKARRVSRLIYILSFGPIPEGQRALHNCDNPRCINPDHLFLGTQKENMEDCSKKRRSRWSVFNPEQIVEIRQSEESLRPSVAVTA